MSLRKINKEKRRAEWGGVAGFFRDISQLKKPEHFTKMQRLRAEKRPAEKIALTTGARKMSPVQERKDIMIIAVIAAVVIGIIVLELWMSGSGQAPPVNQTPQNQTPVNQTPVHVPKPDLIIESLSLNNTAVIEGDSILVTAVVKNIGDAKASNLTVEFLVGSGHLDDENVFALGVNQTAELSVVWATTESAVGSRVLKAMADPTDSIEEADEKNNAKEVSVEVEKDIVVDITEAFKKMSAISLTEFWYSDKYRAPPKSGDGYLYFSLSSGITSEYYLDVAFPGFKTSKVGNISQVLVPDGSESGWNSRWCIRRVQESEDCIWNGPEVVISLKIKDRKLFAEDVVGVEDEITTSDGRIKSIELVGITTAKWPEEKFKTFRVYGGPEPDSFIPLEFYEVVGSKVYIHPMKWNPRTLEAEVAMAFQFKIKTD